MSCLEMMKMMTLRLLLLPLLLMTLPAMAGRVHVATASNFNGALQALAASFGAASGHVVTISAASTGKLYAQIRHGAPYDLLLAADEVRPRMLEQEGLALPGSRFTYALGQLVLWAPGRVFSGEARVLLSADDVRHIAIANPKTAPYGVAAQQALESLGLWQGVEGRLVRGENIGQTFQFVASGGAELGFVALAQLVEWPETGYRWSVPQALYAPIRQQAVLLQTAADNAAAVAFLAYLRSDEARRLIEARGYGLEPLP
jgi:molybdate transport system substrate-binding protein